MPDTGASSPIIVRMPSTSVLPVIRDRLPELNPALRRIGNYIVRAPYKTKALTISALAKNCKVSEATVSRFVRELQFETFQQMKISLAEELSRNDAHGDISAGSSAPRDIYEDISASDPIDVIIRKVHSSLRNTLDQTLETFLPAQVEQVVRAIEESELIYFFATGTSALAAENGVVRLVRTGKRCVYFHDQSIQQLSCINLDARCLAIGISNSGRTRTTVNALQTAQERGAKTICITSFKDSLITRYADVSLITSEQRDGIDGHTDTDAMTAKIGQIAILDVIYSAYAVRHHAEASSALRQTDEYVRGSRM